MTLRNPLHSLCPYFAMFPEGFAEQHINEFSAVGDSVLDPFSGRGTTALQALLMDRRAAAIDINPVAFCVTGAKTQVPDLETVTSEILALEERLRDSKAEATAAAAELPPFFQRAFHEATLQQLVFLRSQLNWRHDFVHRFIAALVLGTLHGESGRSARYLSNQMPRTISPKPAYSLRWWNEHDMWPEPKDAFANLRREAAFRLRGEVPRLSGLAVLGDARRASEMLPHLRGAIRLAITSPPYFDVTNFEEDQWLRLWFLGGPPKVTYRQVSRDDRHDNEQSYWRFLSEVWAGVSSLLCDDATLVCRIGGTGFNEDQLASNLVSGLESTFAAVELVRPPQSTRFPRRQTSAFRPGSIGCRFEVDLVLRLTGRRGQPAVKPAARSAQGLVGIA